MLHTTDNVNTAVEVLYVDTNGHWARDMVVLGGRPTWRLMRRLRRAVGGRRQIVAEQVGLTNPARRDPYFRDGFPNRTADTGWVSIHPAACARTPTDPRTFALFVDLVCHTARAGWDEKVCLDAAGGRSAPDARLAEARTRSARAAEAPATRQVPDPAVNGSDEQRPNRTLRSGTSPQPSTAARR